MKSIVTMSGIIRCGIICLWLSLIVLFLYVGQITQLFYQKKSLNLLVWGQVLDKEYLVDFEKQTGITVNVNYFENNEELFVKLRSTPLHDYDIVMPSDWAAELLIKEGLLKKIDQSRIMFWDDIYPALLNHYFDPGNQYTMPYYWTLYGLGFDARYFKDGQVPDTWGLIFDETIIPKHIALFEDIRPLTFIAALYLFGHINNLEAHEVEKIKTLLVQQRKYVEVYTDNRSEYVLASGVVPVVAGLSGDFLKIMRRFPYIHFMVPREGGFAIIDSLAITSVTKKDDLIYPFLNYLFSGEIVKKYVDKFDFFPAVKVSVDYDESYSAFVYPTTKLFANIHFFKNILSSSILNDILIALKS